MDRAAKSVRGLGKDADKTAIELEVMESVEGHLEKQTEQLAVVMALLERQIEQTGDEAAKTALKMAVLARASKAPGSNAIFLGKSFAFWKDRLSITRSEVIATAYTLGAYLSPALLAVGSSAAQAMLGGGVVAGAGLSSFLFGLGTLGFITNQAVDDLKKIEQAQYQYNIAVDQYGASSKQASRASAHLGAVIKENGGQQAADLLATRKRFGDEFKKATARGRGSIFDIMSGGIGAGRKLLPTLAPQINQMADATNRAMQTAFKALSGGEGKSLIESLGSVFSSSIGPGIKGVTNMIIIMGRVVRAAAPWVVKFADSWERFTGRLRFGTRNQRSVERFINNAVDHFKTWFGLAQALGTTVAILLGNFSDEGQDIVKTLTNVVDKFNEWLRAAQQSGALDRFFDKYMHSLEQIVWAIQHPLDAIELYLPQLMDTISNTMATHAPHAAETFLLAWVNAGAWTKFLSVLFLASKFGVFSALGKSAGKLFVVPFIEAFALRFAGAMGIEVAAGGRIATAMGTAGGAAGRIFGGAFMLAMVAYFVDKWPDIDSWLQDKVRDTLRRAGGGDIGPRGQLGAPSSGRYMPDIEIIKKFGDFLRSVEGQVKVPRGGATGGVIPFGGQAIVGESGMELAKNTPWGTKITPLSGNGLASLRPADTSGIGGAMQVYVNTSVQINRREIAHAVADEVAYITARRGGAKLTDGS